MLQSHIFKRDYAELGTMVKMINPTWRSSSVKRLLTVILLIVFSMTLSVGMVSAQDDFFPEDPLPPIAVVEGGPLELDTAIDGFIEQDQRVEYSLTIAEVTGVSISMQSADLEQFFDPYLRIYDAEGFIVAENDDNFLCECLDSLVRVTLEPGEYTVEAATFVDFDTGPFLLEVLTVPITDEGIIGVGSLFENQLAAPATDVYTLVLSEPQAVRILFDPTEGSSLLVDMVLYDDFGVIAAAVPREPDSRALSLTTFFLGEGEYRLEVSGIEGSGGYVMVVGPPATDRGFLPIGEPIVNFLQSGERARYQLVLSAPQTLNVTVLTTTPFDPANEVALDPDLVQIDENGFEIEFGTLFEAPGGQLGASIQRRFEPGTYTFEVRDFVDAGAGEYLIEARALTVEELGPVTIPQSVGGTIGADELDLYTLPLTEISVVRFTVITPEGSALDPVLRIYDEFGFLVWDNVFTASGPEGVSVTLDLFDANYVIEIGARGQEAIGDYQLFLESAVIERGPVLLGESLQGELESGLRDRYTLTVDGVTDVTVEVLSAEGEFGIAGFDPTLTVYDGEGLFLFYNDDFTDEFTLTTDSRLDVTLEPGTYIIEVASFFDDAAGLYSLTVNGQ